MKVKIINIVSCIYFIVFPNTIFAKIGREFSTVYNNLSFITTCQDEYLILDFVDFDNDIYLYSVTNNGNPPSGTVVDIRRIQSCIDFDWTSNGGCIDQDPNGIINNNDTGIGFKDCIPISYCDFFVPFTYEIRFTDSIGNSTFCQGTILVEFPYGGCTDSTAHNYNPEANIEDGSCQTCIDGNKNGDELYIDCGGQLCQPCIIEDSTKLYHSVQSNNVIFESTIVDASGYLNKINTVSKHGGLNFYLWYYFQFVENTNILYYHSNSNVINYYNFTNNQQGSINPANNNDAFAFLNEGPYLVAGSAQTGAIHSYDNNLQVLHSLDFGSQPVSDLEVDYVHNKIFVALGNEIYYTDYELVNASFLTSYNGSSGINSYAFNDIAYDSTRNNLLIGGANGAKIYLISSGTEVIIANNLGATSVAIDYINNIYWICDINGAVYTYNPEYNQLNLFTNNGVKSPQKIWCSEGFVFIYDQLKGVVIRLDPVSNSRDIIFGSNCAGGSNNSGSHQINLVSVGPDDSYYWEALAQTTPTTILKSYPNIDYTEHLGNITIAVLGYKLNYANKKDIEIDNNGNIYISYLDKIVKYDKDCKTIQTIVSGFTSILEIDIVQEKLLFLDTLSSAIRSYNILSGNIELFYEFTDINPVEFEVDFVNDVLFVNNGVLVIKVFNNVYDTIIEENVKKLRYDAQNEILYSISSGNNQVKYFRNNLMRTLFDQSNITSFDLAGLQQFDLCGPVQVQNHPQSQILNVCENACFRVEVEGTPPFQYNWYRNGVLIPGATLETFTKSGLSLEDNSNTFYCIITNCNGTWRDTSEIAELTVLSPCTFSNPKTILSESILNPEEELVITGLDFTPYGTIDLSVSNEFGEIVELDITMEYSNSGSFLYALPISSDFIHGKYSVNAIDITTGLIAPVKYFYVENYSTPQMWVISPEGGDKYTTNHEFQITWGEFTSATNVSNASGHVQKSYKIEISSNNGGTWQLIQSAYLVKSIPICQNNSYAYLYSINQPGNYLIRISDNSNQANFIMSEQFIVSEPLYYGFNVSYLWDHSCPSSPLSIYPLGVTADGTSRILLKLERAENNTREIASINAIIKPVNSNQTGIDTLGKIIFAEHPFSYSLEGNNANSISCLWEANQSVDEIYFWLIAPDDFTHKQNDQRSEREINVEFHVIYTNNTSETVTTSNRPIKIVRPPLFLVHGLAGNTSAFSDSKYNLEIGSDNKHFNRDIEHGQIEYNPTWKVSQRLGLYPFASFQVNAELILGNVQDPEKYYNTFQAHINSMRNLGFACNRVDFVAHSMGGSVARTIINYYPGLYKFIPNDPKQYKNYEQGFINKLITISTPHNGSYFADFVIDRLPNSLLNFEPYSEVTFKFIKHGIILPAIHNLQSHSGGIIFDPTIVKNHLIGSDIDPFNNQSEFNLNWSLLRPSNDPWDFGLLLAYQLLKPRSTSVSDYISDKYDNDEFLSETDYVVQVSSQLPNVLPQEISNNIANTPSVSSILFGSDKSHMGIQSNLMVGTKIMRLLNSPINSNYFSGMIAGNSYNFNPSTQQFERSMTEEINLFYFDSTHISIIAPAVNDTVLIDSTLNVTIHLLDTFNLKELRVLIFNALVSSFAKDSIQYFLLPTAGKPLGANILIAEAIYDSLGITVSHIDTVTVFVSTFDSLLYLQASPISYILNPDQSFKPRMELVFSTSINEIQLDYNGLDFIIADTNVISFDSTNICFVAQDTGSTFIAFSYLTFSDTIFLYLTKDYSNYEYSTCANDTIQFYAGFLDSTKTYQWQVDTLDTFYDIDTSIYYSGIQSPYISIIAPPTEWYGLRYRCVISDSIGSTSSKIFTLKFGTIWEGTLDSLWENPANWNCSILPDSNCDVTISSEVPNSPVVNSNVYCRTLRLQPGASIKVTTGFQLNTTGGN